jgi:hypothetical protein
MKHLVLSIILLLASCHSQPAAPATTPPVVVINKDTTDFQQVTIEEVMQQMMDRYKDSVHLDTIIQSAHIQFRYYCAYDSALIIPPFYVNPFHLNDTVITHNFQTSINIQINDHPLIDTLINKSFFEDEMFNEPNQYKYGALRFEKLQIEKDRLDLFYYFQIPLTDLYQTHVVLHCYYDDGLLQGKLLD